MKTPKEMIVNSVTHRYAGNNLAVIESYEDEWSRVASFFQDKEGRWKIASQFFLVWTKLLALGDPIHPDALTEIQKLHTDLASGKKVVRGTRLFVV